MAKSCAKRKQLNWNIFKEDYIKLISQVCYYCDGELNKTGSGLDRVNNSKGYELNNVVPCCKRCNMIKSDYLTYNQMLELKPFLIKFRKKQ